MKQEDLEKLSKIESYVLDIAGRQESLVSQQADLNQRLTRVANVLNATIQSIKASEEQMAAELEYISVAPPPVPESALLNKAAEPAPEVEPASIPESAAKENEVVVPASIPESAAMKRDVADSKRDKGFDLEKFIGENLMSKIGVVIILIGVAIFGKYAIDNDLISPLGRILLGAGFGLALIGTGFWLKKSVEKLSAMLVAGGTAVLYLMTYFAYDFYHMMPMMAAALIMVAISAFTIWSAILYRSEAIAIYGQLCAYTVPLLVGQQGGSLLVFLGYTVLINIAITAVSVIHKWNIAYVLSFFATWIIVLAINREPISGSNGEFAILISLIAANMINYYISMAWLKEKDGGWLVQLDSTIMLISTILFFVVGYHQAWNGSGFSGGKLAVTLINIAINALMAAWMYSRNNDNCRRLGNTAVMCAVWSLAFMFFDFFMIRTFVILCTLMMISLYYVANVNKSLLFRISSYVLMGVAAISLLFMYVTDVSSATLFTTVFYGLSLAAMAKVNAKFEGRCGNGEQKLMVVFMVGAALLASTMGVRVMDGLCVYGYILAVLAVFCLGGWLFGRVLDFGEDYGRAWGKWALVVQFLAVPALIAYAAVADNEYQVMRYASWAVLAAAMWINHRKEYLLSGGYLVLMLSSLLAITSFEIWDHIGERLALSIWWGIFAVGCMYAGLVKKVKVLRVYGIVLLSVTLAKLFFFDLKHLDTIAKVVVFVALGLVMLIGTYFYQKNNKGIKE